MSEMTAFHHVLSETLRRYTDMHQCGQEIPAWLEKQAEGIRVMEDNPQRGATIFVEGLRDEVDRLTELLHGQ